MKDKHWSFEFRSGGCVLFLGNMYVEWFETMEDALNYIDFF